MQVNTATPCLSPARTAGTFRLHQHATDRLQCLISTGIARATWGSRSRKFESDHHL